jgi:hypothetical protein
MSSIPYVGVVIINLFSGFLSDFLIEKNIFQKITVRRLFSAVGKISSVYLLKKS